MRTLRGTAILWAAGVALLAQGAPEVHFHHVHLNTTDPAAAITSTPAISTARSDNLFQDYEVDFAKANEAGLSAGDRHMLRNVRRGAGGSDMTCLGCHRLHANSTAKHRLAMTGPICEECDNASGPKKGRETV